VADLPFALALTAGIFAAVNPCGFALLPAYLSLLVVGGPDEANTGGRLSLVARALGLSAAIALGFVAVFGVFGLLAAPIADAVAQRLPWLSVLIGLALAGLGGWLLLGRELPALRIGASRGPAIQRRFGSMVVFGASYAIASLGCTIGPFLAVVVSAFRSGSSPLGGVALFLTYAAGMALIVAIVALAVALANVSVVNRLRRAAPVLNRLGGVLLVIAGLYVAWYGWYEIRVFAGAGTSDPIVDTAAGIQSAISAWLNDLGWTTVVVAFGVLLAATVTTAVLVGLYRLNADRDGTHRSG
jgi:cytochrome c biogenesis protein CcdA